MVGELHTIDLVRIVLILFVGGGYFRLKGKLDCGFVRSFLLLVRLARRFVHRRRMLVGVSFQSF